MKKTKKITALLCTAAMLIGAAAVQSVSAADALETITPVSDMSDWVQTYSKDYIMKGWSKGEIIEDVNLSQEDYIVTFDLQTPEAYNDKWDHARVGVGGGDYVWMGLSGGYIKYRHGYENWLQCDAEYTYDSFNITASDYMNKYWNVYMQKKDREFIFAIREVVKGADGTETPAAEWKGFTRTMGNDNTCLSFHSGIKLSEYKNIKVYKPADTYDKILDGEKIENLTGESKVFEQAATDRDFVLNIDYNWSINEKKDYYNAEFIIGGQSFAVFPYNGFWLMYEGKRGSAWTDYKTQINWSLPPYAEDGSSNVYTVNITKTGNTVSLAYKPKGAENWSAQKSFAVLPGNTPLTFRTWGCASFSNISFLSKSAVTAEASGSNIVVNGSFYSESTGNYMTVLAEYKEDGTLKAIHLLDRQPIVQGTNKVEHTVPVADGTHIVRPFVWETDNLKSLCTSDTVTLQTQSAQ